MVEEQAGESTSSCISCDDNSNSAKYEESLITTDNDLEDDIAAIEWRQKNKIGCPGSTNPMSYESIDEPSTGCSIEDTAGARYSVHDDSNSRPVSYKDRQRVTFSRPTVNYPRRKNVRAVVPYPSNLGSFKVRSRVVHKDFSFRPGDIVSLTENNRVYFAQIKALIQNKFCDKYAAITWLIPKSPKYAQNTSFNPHLFVYGPQDENFYSMNAIAFVMHAPTPYYKRFIPPVPESSTCLRPQPMKRKRSKSKSVRDNIRLPVSIANFANLI